VLVLPCLLLVERLPVNVPRPLLPVDLLLIPFNDLEFHEEIGTGGFGIVYRGVWKSRQEKVAIKRFRSEARVMSGRVAIVIEYMDHGDLSNLVFTHALPSETLARYALEMAKPLAYLHSRSPRIYHRDLKMNNYLVGTVKGDLQDTSLGLCIKVADFGLAHIRQESSRYSETSQFRGVTCTYSAPELLVDGLRYSSKSDVYSLGICLLELFTGQHAWNKYTNTDIIRTLAKKQFPPALNRVDIPLFRRVVGWLLAHQRACRPSASEVVLLLQRVVAGKRSNSGKSPVLSNPLVLSLLTALSCPVFVLSNRCTGIGGEQLRCSSHG
jgi:serine/threonine protein kinase